MNRESERKRLVELLKHECDVDDRYDGEGNCPGCKYNGMEDCSLQELADHLLNNGIVVPPVKVGDKVYQTVLFKDKTGFVVERNVVGFHLGDFPELRGHKRKQYFIVYHETTHSITHIDIDQLGKAVFLTREEAEKMLKGSKNNG